MAGEMQPGEYESAYTGYAARHPRRALRPTARESCGGGARGAGEGTGAGGRVSRGNEVSTLTSGPCLRCSITTNRNMHYPFPDSPHTDGGELGERERDLSALSCNMRPLPTLALSAVCTLQSGAPRSEVSHAPWAGRGRRAASRAAVQRRVEACVGTVGWGGAMTEGGVRRESSGGADTSRRAGSVGGAASGGRCTLLRDALRRLGRRRAHLRGMARAGSAKVW